MDSAQTLKVLPSGFCLFCTAKTNLVCHRCGDFYCSKECQLKDWQRHRYICFCIPSLVHPMACSVFTVAELSSGNPEKLPEIGINDIVKPELKVETRKKISSESARMTPSPAPLSTNVQQKECDKKINNANDIVEIITSAKPTNNKNNFNANGTLKKAELTNIRPAVAVAPSSSCIVYITEMISANRCFIRDASESAEKAYFEICEKVNLMGDKLLKKSYIKPCEYALLKYNGRFYRVKAVGKKVVSPRLFLVDEGIIKVDKKIELREISKELLELPFCSSQVQLKDVPNFMLNDHVFEFLKQFESDKFIATYSKNGHVELQHVESKKSLNAMICEFCSNMEIFGKNPLVDKNNSEPAKKGEQQLVSKKETDASKTPIEKSQMSIKSNQKQAENITEISMKISQSIKAMPDPVKMDNNGVDALEVPIKKSQIMELINYKAQGTSVDQSPKRDDNQQVFNKNADALEIPIKKSQIMENIQKQVAADAALSLSNYKVPHINYDQNQKRDVNQQVYNKDAALFLSDYQVKGVSTDQSPKRDHNSQEIKLDSKPIADVKSTENLNALQTVELNTEEKKILREYQEKGLTKNHSSQENQLDANTINEKFKANANELHNLLLNTEEKKILQAYQENYSIPIAYEKCKENVIELQGKGLLKDCRENSVTINPATPYVGTQKVNPAIDLVKPNLEPLLKPPFEMRRFSTTNKEGFNVIIVDNADVSRGIFGAFDSINANDLSKLYIYLSEFKDLQPYKPILKEYVIAKYENSWYRAKVKGIKENLYTVIYLEFTNEATITEQDIRRYPEDLTVPCHTNVCILEGFPHRPTKRQIDFLKEKLQMNSRLHVDSVNYLQDIAFIKSKTLIDELNKML
ncbi:uncharacterized protein LOC117792147 isoform X2 [Drosophila innubila]|uniref:uncharacterized protein LOC117792147 isoform X2 n=1 Tax=Drosophila innubila TaxID=198719 RepID=UPI00148BADEF|nr:uncharacterized protein LOC117792147 isoform X2 [Drosophila innubila]